MTLNFKILIILRVFYVEGKNKPEFLVRDTIRGEQQYAFNYFQTLLSFVLMQVNEMGIPVL